MFGPAATVGISEIARNSKTESNSIVSAFISVALTIVGATTVLAEMRGAFTSIWSLSRSDVIGITSHTSVTDSSLSTPKNKAVWDFIRSRALSLAALVSLTFILMVSTFLNTVSTILVEAVLRWTGSQDTLAAVISVKTVAFVTSTFVTWVKMWAIFKVLLPVKLTERRLLLATLVATGLFLVGRAVIGIYISSAPQLDLYGAAASLVVLMIWLYYAMQTVLFTACLTAVLNKD